MYKKKIETAIETAPRNDRNANLEYPYCPPRDLVSAPHCMRPGRHALPSRSHSTHHHHITRPALAARAYPLKTHGMLEEEHMAF